MLNKRFANDGNSILKLNKLQKSIRNQINQKILTGVYKFKKVKCIVCNKSDFEFLSEKDRHGFYMPVVICVNCGLVQTNPRMNKKSYNNFYKKEYRKFYAGYKGVSNAFFNHQYAKGKLIFDYITKSTEKEIRNINIAEIGTGAGGILKYFQDKGNYVFGIDLDSEYLKFGIDKGLNLREGDIKNLREQKNKPDIVIYSHVLEHIPNPIKELTELKKYIDKNTLLYIEVPGIKNLYKDYELDFLRYLQNAHVYHFTLDTLVNILHKAGFELVCGNEKINSIFRLSNRKFPIYKNDYEGCLAFLKKLEIGRNNHINTYIIKLRLKKFLVRVLKTLRVIKLVKKYFYISTSLSS